MAIVKCKECDGETSAEADVCPKCGAKFKRPSGCLLMILGAFLGFVMLALIAPLVGKRDDTGSAATGSRLLTENTRDEAYPGPWRTGGPVFEKIALTLGRNAIGGCGEFHYRLAKGKQDPGEALVYCTRDGRNWDHYLVFYKIDNVMRVKAEPGVPLPNTLISED